MADHEQVPAWKVAAAEKKNRIDGSIPLEWRIELSEIRSSSMEYPGESGILSAEELAITESSAVDLVRKMSQGELTSVAVTVAFCKRAAIAQQAVNCLHEFFPNTAIERAKELDAYYLQHKKTVGPLHGLPISLKDQFRIKGLETTMGYVGWIGKCETEDSVLVTLLYNAGAVFYVKTSVVQSLMLCETLNNIIGRTVNPRNKNWSCGGSSGGEGALLGLRGSTIGVGTDLGGSIRVPAAFNSLFGLRPSHGRLPYANMANSMEGQEAIHSVCGPLCHSIEDMRLFMTSVLAEEPWKYDSKVIPMPWRQSEEDSIKQKKMSGGLTIAYYNCDGNVLPHPPVIRAVETVVSKLKKSNHKTVSWQPYKHLDGLKLAGKIFTADCGTDILKVTQSSGEPTIPNIDDYVRSSPLPKTDINELWDINLLKWKYQCEYLSELRSLEQQLGAEIDAIVAPITATAAVRHDQFKYYGYSSIVNILDYTSVVVPVTFVDKTIDVKNNSFKPLSDFDSLVQSEYDPDAYHGAPVAVQVIGRRLTEEKTMAIAEEISRLMRSEEAT